MAFDYTNGFHDAANAIATSISTRALTPRIALAMAAVGNFIGAHLGGDVAKTVGDGLVKLELGIPSLAVVFAGVIGAITWNLITWWFGLPSSSSHALVGGLVGATLATAAATMPEGQSAWTSIIWSDPKPGAPLKEQGGLLFKVLIPMIASPLIGFVAGMLVMSIFYRLVANWRPSTVDRTFRFGQLFSGSYMGFSHGSNDAQKTMGIIALALA